MAGKPAKPAKSPGELKKEADEAAEAKAKLRDADQAAKKAEHAKKVEEAAADDAPDFVICKGRSLACGAHVLNEGQGVTVEVVGGEENLETLIEQGFVEKTG